jgi:hypothetical protein
MLSTSSGPTSNMAKMFSTSSGPTSNMAIMSINFDFREKEIQKKFS